MKTIFTLSFFALTLLQTTPSFSQCNTTPGSNGSSTPAIGPITIDGNTADWAAYLADADNNSYDNTNGIDLDGPGIKDGRDLKRLTFTEDQNYLYLLIEKLNGESSSNIIFYVDLNNNDLMELNEPVIHFSSSGSTGIVMIYVLNYVPSTLNAQANTMSANLDGAYLKGTMTFRTTLGSDAKESADGKFLEARIPFSALTTLTAGNTVARQLQLGQHFKFHLSSTHGNFSTGPENHIDDNFGGCITAPNFNIALPVKLISFTAILDNKKTNLKWETSSEVNAKYFAVERSTDGINFNEAGIVFANGNTSSRSVYSFADNISTIQASVIYYRLRSVDLDGKQQYSDIRMIRVGKADTGVSILAYPNPVVNEVRITIPTSWQNKKVVYELVNANGQVAKRMETNGSNQTETINATNLVSGLYIVKVSCANETAQQKIIKQ